jgi:hypothetical protein
MSTSQAERVTEHPPMISAVITDLGSLLSFILKVVVVEADRLPSLGDP